MIRIAFLKRMALAAAACAFIDVPWPAKTQYEKGLARNSRYTIAIHDLTSGEIREVEVTTLP